LFIGIVTVASIALTSLYYFSFQKIEVKLVKVRFYRWYEQQLTLRIALNDFDWRTTTEARSWLRDTTSNSTNTAVYDLTTNWDNYFVGGQVREQDSPGNYLLRETNKQLQLVIFNGSGGEEISGTWDLPHKQ